MGTIKLSTFPTDSGVYCIKNKSNSKVYIGSSNNIRKRLRKHFGTLRNCKHDNKYLQNSFNKYGEQGFEIIILASPVEYENLLLTEQKFLDEHKSYDRNYGYNLSTMADRTILTEEGKQKLRLHNLGKKYSKEVNQKKGHKGKLNPFYGKKHNSKTKGKMVLNRGLKFSPFVCIETGEIFNFFIDAATKTNSRMASISKCLKKEMYVSNGLHFMYLDEIYFTFDKSETHVCFSIQQQAELIALVDPRRKLFICIQTGEIFTSVNEASAKYHIRRSSLSDHLKGKIIKPCKELSFKYI